MQTFSSAKRTCSASASAVEWTATDRSPSSRQARITRSAISPRLAMRTFLNTWWKRVGGRGRERPSSGLRQAEQRLAVLDVLAVARQDLDDLAVGLGLDLVHELHGLDDADHLTLAHRVPHLYERRSLGRRRAIEGADERRRDEGAGFGRALDRRRRSQRDGRARPGFVLPFDNAAAADAAANSEAAGGDLIVLGQYRFAGVGRPRRDRTGNNIA